MQCVNAVLMSQAVDGYVEDHRIGYRVAMVLVVIEIEEIEHCFHHGRVLVLKLDSSRSSLLDDFSLLFTQNARGTYLCMRFECTTEVFGLGADNCSMSQKRLFAADDGKVRRGLQVGETVRYQSNVSVSELMQQRPWPIHLQVRG